MTGTPIQEGVLLTQESKATTSSIKTSQNSSEPDDGPTESHSSLTRSHDSLLTSQEPGLATPPRPALVDEQMIEKNENIDAISPSKSDPPIDSLSFTPKSLSDVFLSVTPPVRVQFLLSFLTILIKVFYHHDRVAETDLLTFYSNLAVDSAEKPDHAPLQVSQLLIEASRLVAKEDLDGLLSVFFKIISMGDSSTEVCYVSLDYTIIMNKLDRPAETERVLNQIFYSKRATRPFDPIKVDRDLARDLQDVYVWLKKTLSTCQRLQGRVNQSLQTLLTTLETAQAVFGVNSLSYFHAAFLLRRFYSCNYQQATSSTLKLYREEEKKYSAIFLSVLESLYCNSKSGSDGGGGGGKQACSAECLHMGVILWAQGALEETVAVFEAFAELRAKITGEDDILVKKARRATALAKEEWDLSQNVQRRKEDVLKFGTIVFPRKVKDLMFLLEKEEVEEET